jgi:hypothetical protein
MLYHSVVSPEAGAYFYQMCFSLEGDLNVSRFHNAWEARLPICRAPPSVGLIETP